MSTDYLDIRAVVFVRSVPRVRPLFPLLLCIAPVVSRVERLI